VVVCVCIDRKRSRALSGLQLLSRKSLGDHDEGVWWCVIVWRCGGVMVCGGVWWCVAVCGGVWWCVMCGGVWWCVAVCGGV
jgi:hypothetical protein